MSADRSRSGAFLVGAGIFLSRIAGLVRQKIFAHYFSTSLAADAFNAAFRIPNLLQNLLGEGVLSASFIPQYSGLLARKNDREADRLAGAVFSALALVASLLVLAGILLAPLLVGMIAPGFTGEKRALTVTLTQILFPGAGLLVFSAWCLGILNSHRRFFVSYTAPVVWSLAMIVALLWFGGTTTQPRLAEILAWASVAGSALQFAVQLPLVFRLAHGLHLNLDFKSEHARSVFRNFIPAFVSRGVVQISAFIDAFIASWLPTGSVATLAYAQVLYTLPVSLFGMAVSAAELPIMSSAVGTDAEVAEYLRGRIVGGLGRIAFFIRRRVSGTRRCDLRDSFRVGPLHARGHVLGLAGTCGIDCWIAGIHVGQTLFVCVLCTARHENPAQLRSDTCCTDQRSRNFCRTIASRDAWT
jgi:putative peptidoglycan lipid II flippase